LPERIIQCTGLKRAIGAVLHLKRKGEAMSSFEVLVIISSTEDFAGWSRSQKLERYRRVVEWHDYAENLQKEGKITHLWGSHQLLSRHRFVNSMGVLLAVYNVTSWSEFDELLLLDPLRDISRYLTSPLTRLLKDREEDVERFERHKAQIEASDANQQLLHDAYRSLYTRAPDYVGRAEQYHQPLNLPTEPGKLIDPAEPLEIFVLGTNPGEAMFAWDDSRQAFHYEKVTWWHDYTSMLIDQKKISHVWGAHAFFDMTQLSGEAKGAGIVIYTVNSFSEFDHLFQLDPIRESTVFWTILLQPIAEQRNKDVRRLEIETARE
jgi:hypothetical protein